MLCLPNGPIRISSDWSHFRRTLRMLWKSKVCMENTIQACSARLRLFSTDAFFAFRIMVQLSVERDRSRS